MCIVCLPARSTGLATKRSAAAALCLFALLLAGCGATHGATKLTGALPDRSAGEANRRRLQALIAARAMVGEQSEYRISPGDLLSITIYNFRPGGGDFVTDVRVDEHGYIGLPMIEPLPAAGLTVAQLEQSLGAALRHGDVMRQPMLKVFLKDYVGQQVVLLGAVMSPGTYHLSRGRHTLVDVISMAGGLKPTAGNYVLVHPGDDSSGPGSLPIAQRYALNSAALQEPLTEPSGNAVLISLLGDHGIAGPGLAELVVRGGDLIIVPEAGQAFLEGEVAKSGVQQLSHGMTLTQLIATAGGLRFPAARNRIRLVRRTSGQDTSQWVIDLRRIEAQEQPDILLEPQDRIVVPATPGRKAVYSVYQFFATIVRIGVGGSVALF